MVASQSSTMLANSVTVTTGDVNSRTCFRCAFNSFLKAASCCRAVSVEDGVGSGYGLR